MGLWSFKSLGVFILVSKRVLHHNRFKKTTVASITKGLTIVRVIIMSQVLKVFDLIECIGIGHGHLTSLF